MPRDAAVLNAVAAAMMQLMTTHLRVRQSPKKSVLHDGRLLLSSLKTVRATLNLKNHESRGAVAANQRPSPVATISDSECSKTTTRTTLTTRLTKVRRTNSSLMKKSNSR